MEGGGVAEEVEAVVEAGVEVGLAVVERHQHRIGVNKHTWFWESKNVLY